MRTGFNGFTAGETVIMDDEPMASAYVDAVPEKAVPSNVVKL